MWTYKNCDFRLIFKHFSIDSPIPVTSFY
jgi:hypothetical protein